MTNPTPGQIAQNVARGLPPGYTPPTSPAPSPILAPVSAPAPKASTTPTPSGGGGGGGSQSTPTPTTPITSTQTTTPVPSQTLIPSINVPKLSSAAPLLFSPVQSYGYDIFGRPIGKWTSQEATYRTQIESYERSPEQQTAAAQREADYNALISKGYTREQLISGAGATEPSGFNNPVFQQAGETKTAAAQAVEAKRQADVAQVQQAGQTPTSTSVGTPIQAPANTVWITRSDLPAGGFYRTFGTPGQTLVNAEGQQVSYLDFGAGANRVISTQTGSGGTTTIKAEKPTETIALVPEGSNRAVNVSANILANAIRINEELGLSKAAPVRIGDEAFKLTFASNTVTSSGEPTTEGKIPGQREKALEAASQAGPFVSTQYTDKEGKPLVFGNFAQFGASEREALAAQKANIEASDKERAPYAAEQDKLVQQFAQNPTPELQQKIVALSEKSGFNYPSIESWTKPTSQEAVASSIPLSTESSVAEKTASKLRSALGFDAASGFLFSPANPLNWGQAYATSMPVLAAETPAQKISTKPETVSSTTPTFSTIAPAGMKTKYGPYKPTEIDMSIFQPSSSVSESKAAARTTTDKRFDSSTFSYPTTGTKSMSPFITNQDTVLIQRVPPSEIKPGDVVLWQLTSEERQAQEGRSQPEFQKQLARDMQLGIPTSGTEIAPYTPNVGGIFHQVIWRDPEHFITQGTNKKTNTTPDAQYLSFNKNYVGKVVFEPQEQTALEKFYIENRAGKSNIGEVYSTAFGGATKTVARPEPLETGPTAPKISTSPLTATPVPIDKLTMDDQRFLSSLGFNGLTEKAVNANPNLLIGVYNARSARNVLSTATPVETRTATPTTQPTSSLEPGTPIGSSFKIKTVTFDAMGMPYGGKPLYDAKTLPPVTKTLDLTTSIKPPWETKPTTTTPTTSTFSTIAPADTETKYGPYKPVQIDMSSVQPGSSDSEFKVENQRGLDFGEVKGYVKVETERPRIGFPGLDLIPQGKIPVYLKQDTAENTFKLDKTASNKMAEEIVAKQQESLSTAVVDKNGAAYLKGFEEGGFFKPGADDAELVKFLLEHGATQSTDGRINISPQASGRSASAIRQETENNINSAVIYVNGKPYLRSTEGKPINEGQAVPLEGDLAKLAASVGAERVSLESQAKEQLGSQAQYGSILSNEYWTKEREFASSPSKKFADEVSGRFKTGINTALLGVPSTLTELGKQTAATGTALQTREEKFPGTFNVLGSAVTPLGPAPSFFFKAAGGLLQFPEEVVGVSGAAIGSGLVLASTPLNPEGVSYIKTALFRPETINNAVTALSALTIVGGIRKSAAKAVVAEDVGVLATRASTKSGVSSLIEKATAAATIPINLAKSTATGKIITAAAGSLSTATSSPIAKTTAGLVEKGAVAYYVLSDPEAAGKTGVSALVGAGVVGRFNPYTRLAYGKDVELTTEQLRNPDVLKAIDPGRIKTTGGKTYATFNPEEIQSFRAKFPDLFKGASPVEGAKVLTKAGNVVEVIKKAEPLVAEGVSSGAKVERLGIKVTKGGQITYQTAPFYEGLANPIVNPIRGFAYDKYLQASKTIPYKDIFGREAAGNLLSQSVPATFWKTAAETRLPVSNLVGRVGDEWFIGGARVSNLAKGKDIGKIASGLDFSQFGMQYYAKTAPLPSKIRLAEIGGQNVADVTRPFEDALRADYLKGAAKRVGVSTVSEAKISLVDTIGGGASGAMSGEAIGGAYNLRLLRSLSQEDATIMAKHEVFERQLADKLLATGKYTPEEAITLAHNANSYRLPSTSLWKENVPKAEWDKLTASQKSHTSQFVRVPQGSTEYYGKEVIPNIKQDVIDIIDDTERAVSKIPKEGTTVQFAKTEGMGERALSKYEEVREASAAAYYSPAPKFKPNQDLISALGENEAFTGITNPYVKQAILDTLESQKATLSHYGSTSMGVSFTRKGTYPLEPKFTSDLDTQIRTTIRTEALDVTPQSIHKELVERAVNLEKKALMKTGMSEAEAGKTAAQNVAKSIKLEEGSVLVESSGAEAGWKWDVHDRAGAIGKPDQLFGSNPRGIGFGFDAKGNVVSPKGYILMDPREQLVRFGSSVSIPRFSISSSTTAPTADESGKLGMRTNVGMRFELEGEPKRMFRFRQYTAQLGEEQKSGLERKAYRLSTKFTPGEETYAKQQIDDLAKAGVKLEMPFAPQPKAVYSVKPTGERFTLRLASAATNVKADRPAPGYKPSTIDRVYAKSTATALESKTTASGKVSPIQIKSISQPSVSPSLSPSSQPSLQPSPSPPPSPRPSPSMRPYPSAPPYPSPVPSPSPSLQPSPSPSPSPSQPSIPTPPPFIPGAPRLLDLSPIDVAPVFSFAPRGYKRGTRNILADLLSTQYSQLKYGRATHGSAERYAPYYGLEQGRIYTVEQLEEKAGRLAPPGRAPAFAKGSVWQKLAAKRKAL